MLAHVHAGWGFQAVPVLVGALSLALFAQGWARLRARAPEHAGLERPFLLALAVACGVLPLV